MTFLNFQERRIIITKVRGLEKGFVILVGAIIRLAINLFCFRFSVQL